MHTYPTAVLGPAKLKKLELVLMANAQNISQNTLYSVQHIHINLTLIYCTLNWN